MNRIFISLMITLLLVGFSGCGQKKSTMHPLVVATPEYCCPLKLFEPKN